MDWNTFEAVKVMVKLLVQMGDVAGTPAEAALAIKDKLIRRGVEGSNLTEPQYKELMEILNNEAVT